MKEQIKENLKSLQLILKKNQDERDLLISQMKELQLEVDAKEANIFEIEDKIQKLESNQIILSEHAILRYLERVENIDIEEVKNKILTEEFKKQFSVLGDGKYPIGNKFFARVKDNVVVTILPIENE
jgi:hypothetical protein